jgi:hypothetical protein
MRNEDGAFVVTIAWTAGNIFLSNFIIRFSDMAHGWLRALRWVRVDGLPLVGASRLALVLVAPASLLVLHTLPHPAARTPPQCAPWASTTPVPFSTPPLPAPLRSFLSAANYAYSAVLRAEFSSGYLSCEGGLGPGLIKGLQTLLPATAALRSTAVLQMAARAGTGCVVDLEAVLDYFDVTLSAGSYIAVLALYLWVMHVITYGALLLLARRERR